MSYNGQNPDFTGFTGFSADSNNFGSGSSNAVDDFFDLFNAGNNTDLDLQNHQHAGPSVPNSHRYLRVPQVGGPSQLHRPEVTGDSNSLSYLNNPTTAPVSLYSGDHVSLDEGESRPMPRKPSFRASFIYHAGHNSQLDAEWAQTSTPDPFGLFSLDHPSSHLNPVSISTVIVRLIQLTRSLRMSHHLGLSLPLWSRPLLVLSGQVKKRRGRKDTTLEGRQRGRKTSTRRTTRMAGM